MARTLEQILEALKSSYVEADAARLERLRALPESLRDTGSLAQLIAMYWDAIEGLHLTPEEARLVVAQGEPPMAPGVPRDQTLLGKLDLLKALAADLDNLPEVVARERHQGDLIAIAQLDAIHEVKH